MTNPPSFSLTLMYNVRSTAGAVERGVYLVTTLLRRN
jgi:hypothetical protein